MMGSNVHFKKMLLAGSVEGKLKQAGLQAGRPVSPWEARGDAAGLDETGDLLRLGATLNVVALVLGSPGNCHAHSRVTWLGA